MLNTEARTESHKACASCPKCGDIFVRQADMINHLMSKHVELASPEIKRETMTEIFQAVERFNFE